MLLLAHFRAHSDWLVVVDVVCFGCSRFTSFIAVIVTELITITLSAAKKPIDPTLLLGFFPFQMRLEAISST